MTRKFSKLWEGGFCRREKVKKGIRGDFFKRGGVLGDRNKKVFNNTMKDRRDHNMIFSIVNSKGDLVKDLEMLK